MPLPNPGSDAAIKLGCLCPIVDNHYGRGVPMKDGTAAFWQNAVCPVHRLTPHPEDFRAENGDANA